MFDYTPPNTRDETLDLARCLFFDHGHDLAEAASRLGGACGEAKVVACALQIETATRMTYRIRRELNALHRLLSLADVGDPECLETELFAALSPADPEVETICLLTDRLAELLEEVDLALARRAEEGAPAATITA
ncbi:hypothetical protein [Citreimonas salinaria]|uniref:Uncharacterized protein n=1 Tax=Citreimonas salinaria TaxID=321339 RepID=A0A1H3JCX2_9RHOB|nr:hypothetical protein [Citreimonas salinaria]SDY37258.1 hypothetical protein SAMN05444340_106183 [Citreimonas salinaria]